MGTYRILVRIDFAEGQPAGVVSEQDENNNAAVGYISQASVTVVSPFHPADTNTDWCIEMSEAIGYAAGWQQGMNPMAYAIRALYIRQKGPCYHREASVSEPMCWEVASP